MGIPHPPPAPVQAQSRGGVGGPVARGPTGGPSSAHREWDVPDAAHRIAVVSRVDSPGEDLMQMHLGIPAGPCSAPEEDEPRARPQPLPVRPRDSASRSPVACRPPPGHERLRPPQPDRRSAAEMPGCSHGLPHRRTVRAQGRGACEAGAAPGSAQAGRVRGRHAARQGEAGARPPRERDAERKERAHTRSRALGAARARARHRLQDNYARRVARTLCAGCARRRAGVPCEPAAQTSGGGARGPACFAKCLSVSRGQCVLVSTTDLRGRTLPSLGNPMILRSFCLF